MLANKQFYIDRQGVRSLKRQDRMACMLQVLAGALVDRQECLSYFCQSGRKIQIRLCAMGNPWP